MSNFKGGGRFSWVLALALGLPAVPAIAQEANTAAEPLGERESYAFVRTLAGDVAVASEGQSRADAIERNQPLLTGDRIETGRGSRIEVILPDRNRLTVDTESAVRLSRLAYSGDRESRITVLGLDWGEILLEVSAEALGDELPRVESESGTIYVQEPGLYRVRVERDGRMEVVTREGYAELVTSRGSTLVRSGESARAGDSRGRVQVAQAGAHDGLEQWSVDVARVSRRAGGSARHLDSSLDYAADDLDNNGDWVVSQGVSYWRPRVSVGWRPYWDGNWGWTPSGYTWISYEPWGWVPYHYGRWSYLPVHGWAWHPGVVYSPAWVYWHWSGGYAGWCPTGYYYDYYSPWYHGGFRWGAYGWAGGSWGHYSHWNFAPVHCFRDRNFRGHVRRGDDYRRENRSPEAPRGLITTDTRDFHPGRIDRTDQILHKIQDREVDTTLGVLPDVTDFVGRKRDLPPTVVKAIAPAGPKGPRLLVDRTKVAETPGWRADAGSPRGAAKGDAPEPTIHGGKRIASPTSPTSPTSPRLGDTGADVARRTIDAGKPAVDPGTTMRRIADTQGDTKGDARRSDRDDAALSGTKGSTPTPRTTAPRTAAPVADSGSRQGWKERLPVESPIRTDVRTPAAPRYEPRSESKDDSVASPGRRPSAPVERVISGTRRTAPKPDGGESPSSSGASGSPRSTGKVDSVPARPAYEAPRPRPGYDASGGGSKSPTYAPRPTRGEVSSGGSASGASNRAAGAPAESPAKPSASAPVRQPAASTPGRQPAASSSRPSGGSSSSTAKPSGGSGQKGSESSSSGGSKSSGSQRSGSSSSSKTSGSSGDDKR